MVKPLKAEVRSSARGFFPTMDLHEGVTGVRQSFWNSTGFHLITDWCGDGVVLTFSRTLCWTHLRAFQLFNPNGATKAKTSSSSGVRLLCGAPEMNSRNKAGFSCQNSNSGSVIFLLKWFYIVDLYRNEGINSGEKLHITHYHQYPISIYNDIWSKHWLNQSLLVTSRVQELAIFKLRYNCNQINPNHIYVQLSINTRGPVVLSLANLQQLSVHDCQ